MKIPLTWKKAKRIFVNSMSDLFHKDVPDDYIEQVCKVMTEADHHTYQVLTKRSERMSELLQGRLRLYALQKHIWFGVSVEDKKYGLPRIEHLRQAKCAMPWLSIEPLIEDLGTIDLTGISWVVVGGESGHGARPCLVEWVRSLRDHSLSAGVPFFFKQWGGVRKKLTGRHLDGRTWDEYPGANPVVVEIKKDLATVRHEAALKAWATRRKLVLA
jgi:protein gp37